MYTASPSFFKVVGRQVDISLDKAKDSKVYDLR